MELDDLKQQWDQADQLQKPKNQNIMKLIQNKSYGPVAELKRSYKRQIMQYKVYGIWMIMERLPRLSVLIPCLPCRQAGRRQAGSQ